jgi:two-component system, OmpR family, sensor kinase
MTLRTRLLISLGGLLAVALVVSGALVVGLTRASLVQQVDAQLVEMRADLRRPGPGRGGAIDPTGRRLALLVLDQEGQLLQGMPSGFPRHPDALPSIPARGEQALPLGEIVERPAIDGSLAYRMLSLEAQEGLVLVLAAPLREVDEAVGVLMGTLLAVGTVVMAALLVVGWLLIRRDLRPLERVTSTAERISAGDLRQRVGLPVDVSEVGRLGRAFDSMLDQIETSFEQQRAALAAKEVSEQRLRRFVADASHELRTPLTSLRGYADLYRSGGLADPLALEAAMTRIGRESQRMATLVEDLLLLARLDQGRPLKREPVALSRLVADALTDAQALEPTRPMQADLAPDVEVSGDEDRLRQVLGNLLANVRVHTPPDAPVEVSLSSADGTGTLHIADHGHGVPDGHAERIFDRFYRADPGRSRDRGGSGLGLSIAASIVEAHGGSISHSPTPGGGATFTVRLPLSQR